MGQINIMSFPLNTASFIYIYIYILSRKKEGFFKSFMPFNIGSESQTYFFKDKISCFEDVSVNLTLDEPSSIVAQIFEKSKYILFCSISKTLNCFEIWVGT